MKREESLVIPLFKQKKKPAQQASSNKRHITYQMMTNATATATHVMTRTKFLFFRISSSSLTSFNKGICYFLHSLKRFF